jgi:hypothetical protein
MFRERDFWRDAEQQRESAFRLAVASWFETRGVAALLTMRV